MQDQSRIVAGTHVYELKYYSHFLTLQALKLGKVWQNHVNVFYMLTVSDFEYLLLKGDSHCVTSYHNHIDVSVLSIGVGTRMRVVGRKPPPFFFRLFF